MMHDGHDYHLVLEMTIVQRNAGLLTSSLYKLCMKYDGHNLRTKVEIFYQWVSHAFFEGSYQSSDRVNEDTTDQDDAFDDSEDDRGLAMIDEVFSEDDAETSPLLPDKT